jgi:pSer/pThr/pTyr-binding forkhead associated (FHA) protein
MGTSLVVVHVDGRQSEVALHKPLYVLGRATDCSLRIPSGKVSRHHCEIALSDGKVAVRDLGSSNGTYVNRRRVTQTELAAGDMVCVGDFVFVVRIDGKPSVVDSEEVLEDGLVQTSSSRPSGADASGETKTSGKPTTSAKPVDADLDSSSVSDFDFLDEDDEMKNQPKL